MVMVVNIVVVVDVMCKLPSIAMVVVAVAVLL